MNHEKYLRKTLILLLPELRESREPNPEQAQAQGEDAPSVQPDGRRQRAGAHGPRSAR